MHDERKLALIDTDHRRLVRAAARLLGMADAEDTVQDAYVRALEAQPQALKAAQAWMLTVARNLAVERLRRRQWMQQWLDMSAGDAALAAPSAEMDAAMAEDTAHALRVLTATLAPEDGAAVLLLEVFDASHAEIAHASGRSEASSRQQLRRALSRLRSRGCAPASRSEPELEPGEETVFRLYLQSLQLRDPQTLWAMLRQAPISACASLGTAAGHATTAASQTACGVMQVGGQLSLVLTLDGIRLCVPPLGVRREVDPEGALS